VGKNKRKQPPGISGEKPERFEATVPYLGLVMDSISDNIIQLDLQNRVLWANSAAAKSLGLENEQIIGKKCYKLWGRSSSDCRDCPTIMARNTGQTHSREMTSKDGRIWQVTSHPVKDEKGKVSSVVEISREVTEIRRAREQEIKLLQGKGVISEIALQLAKTSDEDQIFKLINQGIQKLAGNAVSIVSSFNVLDSSLTVKEIAGTSSVLKKINEIVGQRIGRMKFSNIPAKIIKEFRLGRMVHLKDGLAEAAFGEFSLKMVKSLTNVLGIGKVYGMGMCCGQDILGTVTICQLGEPAELNQDLIENFINQAAMALNRVRIEKEIKFSQDYFHAIIENTSEIITILDSEGIIKYKSASLTKELGYKPDDLLGKNVFDYIHPEDVPGLIVKFNQEINNSGAIIRIDLRFKHKDGSWQDLESTCINLLKNPAVSGVVISSRNITEKKKSEQVLKQSEQKIKENEQKFRELADSLPQTIFETDKTGRFTYANKAAFRQFGYKPSDIEKGLNIFQVLMPEDRIRAKENFNRRAQGGLAENQEYTALTSTGEKFIVNIYANPIVKDGIYQGFRGVVIDITERKTAAQELLKTQMRMKHLLTASPAVIYSVIPNKDFQLTYISENVSSVLEYETGDFFKTDHFWSERIHPDDKVKFKADEKLLLRQGYVTFEYRFRLKDGRYRWVRDGMQIIYDNKGRPSEGIGYLIDITDLKKTEENLTGERDLVKSIFDSSPDALIVSDLEGAIIDSNYAAREMLGTEALKGNRELNITDLVENISRERFSEIKKIILKNGAFRDLSLMMRGRGARTIQAEANISLVRDVESGQSLMVSTIRDVSERKLMEQALKESEEKHRLLLDSIHSPILALDHDLSVLYCNQGYFKIIGKQDRDLVGKKLLEVYPSFKKSKSYLAYKKCLDTGETQLVEGHFNDRFLRVSIYPTKWGLLAVAEDATESQIAQEQLEESRRKLETLMGNLPGMVYRCRNDKDWTIEITNDGCLELTGYAPDELIENKVTSFYQVIHPADREMVWDYIQGTLQKKTAYQIIYRIISRNGTEKWVWEQGQGVYDEKGVLQALEGFITDISDRKRAEDALHASEYQYRSTIDALGDAIHVVDTKLNIMLTNQVFKDWNKKMGLSSEAVGKSIFKIYPYLPKDRVIKEYQTVFDSGKLLITEEENLINHQRVVTETRKIPIIEDGKVVRVITVVRDITERKLAEETLRETETRLVSLSDNIPKGLVYQIDSGINGEQRKFTYISAGVEKLHESTSEEVMRDASVIYGQIIEEDRVIIADHEKKALSSMEPLNAELRLRMPSGRIRWSLFISSPRRLPNNHLVWDGLEIDITESKEAQEKLKESEANYRALFDQASDGIMFMAIDGSRLIVNDSFARMHGYANRKEMEHISLNELDAPESAKLAPDRMRRMIEGEALQFEVEHIHRNGHSFPLQVSCSVIQIGEKSYFLGFHRDISERKIAEQKLTESEANYRQIFDGVAEGIYRSTPEGRVLLANPALARMLGYDSTKELMKRNIESEGYPDPSGRKPFLEKMEEEGQVRELVSEWKRRDGQTIIVKENAHAVRDQSGKTVYYEGTVEDITEKSRAAEALRASEYQYRTTIDSMGDAIHVVDRNMRVILSNQVFMHWCRDLNLGPEVLNRDIFEVCPFLDKKVLDEYKAVFREKKLLVTEEINEVAGKSITTETRKIPVFEDNEVIRVITVIRDVTEQKKAELAVKQNEQRYKALADSSPDFVYVINRDAKIKYANRKAAGMVGLSGEQAIGQFITGFFPQSVNETQAKQLEDVFKTGKQVHYEVAAPINNQVLWLETWLVPLSDEKGVVKEVMGVCRDLTERINMENALKESEKKYRQIFEGISEGIYRSTPDGKLLFANPSLIRMLGYSNPEDVQGIDLNSMVYRDKGTREKFISQIEKDGEVNGFEAEMVNRQGKTLIVSENARMVKNESGKFLYYEGTIEDVTVRKKAERALKDEKNKLEHMFKVSLSVARAQFLQEKLELTIKGINDCHLFRKAVIVLEDRNGYRSHIAQYGLMPDEVSNIERSPITDAKHKSKIFLSKYRISNSYFIPHDDTEVHKYFAARFVNKDYKSIGSWHREDVLIVPLSIKGFDVGYLSVDEPYDGDIPGIETIHLLELFVNQAAIAIENIRLYNDLERSYYDTLKAFVAAMDAKDPYTKGHSENVRHYALKIAKHIGLPEDRLKLIDYSSLLHDIGKLGIREDILAKPDVLSATEFQEVKLHPVIGSRLVVDIDALSQTGDIIYCHHEYFDGSGYPRGIKGEDIPLESRIIAVADAFEAMTSDRPYRKAFSFEVALQRLQDASGTQFDHAIVSAFTELFRKESSIGEGD
jgi:PAS domain S-box-containing protein